MSDKCPICISECSTEILDYTHAIDCPRCGKFIIEGEARIELGYNGSLTPTQIANASGWIRQNQRITIDSDYVETLRNLPTPTVAEKANKLLLYYSKEYPIPGQAIPCDINTTSYKKENLHLLSISWCANFEEFAYLFHTYLVQTKRFLVQGQSQIQFIITPEGWAYIDSLKQINPDSNIGFVAMRFHKKTELLWSEAIKPGIENAGYEPKRMDRHEHSNRIDDEMIAVIRRSKFLVADFTDQRQNVYFEAGFALGLGLHVIWVCRKDEVEENKVHFDTRQYPFIRWEEGKLDDLRKALQDRIEATLGRGKKPSST
jgi:hypothetical protein